MKKSFKFFSIHLTILTMADFSLRNVAISYFHRLRRIFWYILKKMEAVKKKKTKFFNEFYREWMQITILFVRRNVIIPFLFTLIHFQTDLIISFVAVAFFQIPFCVEAKSINREWNAPKENCVQMKINEFILTIQYCIGKYFNGLNRYEYL